MTCHDKKEQLQVLAIQQERRSKPKIIELLYNLWSKPSTSDESNISHLKFVVLWNEHFATAVTNM